MGINVWMATVKKIKSSEAFKVFQDRFDDLKVEHLGHGVSAQFCRVHHIDHRKHIILFNFFHEAIEHVYGKSIIIINSLFRETHTKNPNIVALIFRSLFVLALGFLFLFLVLFRSSSISWINLLNCHFC